MGTKLSIRAGAFNRTFVYISSLETAAHHIFGVKNKGPKRGWVKTIIFTHRTKQLQQKMRHLNVKILGIIAIIGAPWALIDFIDNGLYDRFVLTSESGIRNFIFMTGWICSVLALYKLHQPLSRGQRIVFWVQLVLLLLANVWNTFEIFDPYGHSAIFSILDAAWPIGGLFMVVTAIVIIRANKLRGWKRYFPLLASLWFPQTMFLAMTKQISFTSLLLSGIYSAISFGLLGFSLMTSSNQPIENRAVA